MSKTKQANERRYIALRQLKIGRQQIRPGGRVPIEQGRNYRAMVVRGEIAEVDAE